MLKSAAKFLLLCSVGMWFGCSSAGKKSGVDTLNSRPGLASQSADSVLLRALRDSTGMKGSNVTIKDDTLKITASSWLFYYPFGKFATLTDVESISKTYKVRKMPGDVVELSYGVTKVKFALSRSTGRYELLSGTITDPALTLANGIKVGLDKPAFMNAFFKDSAHVLSKAGNINVVQFLTGSEGLNQCYDFKDDKLASIRFDPKTAF